VTRTARIFPSRPFRSSPHPSQAMPGCGATLAGVVHDYSGAVLSGATVTVRQTETSATRVLTTDSRPLLRASSRRPYTIAVEHDAFNRRSKPASCCDRAERAGELHAWGEHGRETVVVNAGDPVVNTTSQQTAGLVDERQVKELPLNGRSFDQLLTLNPATVNYTGAFRQHRNLQLLGGQHVFRRRRRPQTICFC